MVIFCIPYKFAIENRDHLEPQIWPREASNWPTGVAWIIPKERPATIHSCPTRKTVIHVPKKRKTPIEISMTLVKTHIYYIYICIYTQYILWVQKNTKSSSQLQCWRFVVPTSSSGSLAAGECTYSTRVVGFCRVEAATVRDGTIEDGGYTY